eukprot:446338_1
MESSEVVVVDYGTTLTYNIDSLKNGLLEQLQQEKSLLQQNNIRQQKNLLLQTRKVVEKKKEPDGSSREEGCGGEPDGKGSNYVGDYGGNSAVLVVQWYVNLLRMILVIA